MSSPVRVAFVAAEPAVAMDRGTGRGKAQLEGFQFSEYRPEQRSRLLRLGVEPGPADDADHPVGRPELQRVAALNKTLPVLVSETPMKSRVNRFGAGSSKRQ